MLLFELLLFSGDIDRASKQLEVLRYESPQAVAVIRAYSFAIIPQPWGEFPTCLFRSK